MKKMTLAAVAKQAGVGEATVDRVLNERGNVAPATAAKVIHAARELGLKRVLPDEWRSLRHIEVFLSANKAWFFTRLGDSFLQAASVMSNHRLLVHRTFIHEGEPQKLAAKINAAARTRDGLIVFGHDHPEVRQAIEDAERCGTPVVTIVTDLPGVKRLCHVSIDQYQAGRTAGLMLGSLCRQAGEVMVVGGRFDFLAHKQRVEGFCQIIAERFPHLRLGSLIEGMELRHTVGKLVDQRLARSANIVGVYNTGLGNQAIGEALRRYPHAGGRVFIGHEIYPTTRALLLSGEMTLVLDQNAQLHAYRSLEILLRCLNSGEQPAEREAGQVAFTLHTCENIEI